MNEIADKIESGLNLLEHQIQGEIVSLEKEISESSHKELNKGRQETVQFLKELCAELRNRRISEK